MARINKHFINYFHILEIWSTWNHNSQLSIRISQICLSSGYLWRSIIQENTPETLKEPRNEYKIYLLKFIPYAKTMISHCITLYLIMISAFFQLTILVYTVSKLQVIYSYNILCSYFSENVKDFMYLRTQDDIRLYILHVSMNVNLYKFIWFYNIYIFISQKKIKTEYQSIFNLF